MFMVVGLYRKRSKSWNLARRLRKFFCLERATIVRVQGASEDKKFAAKPTLPSSNFLTVSGIIGLLWMNCCFSSPPKEIPLSLYEAYTLNGQIPIENWYIDGTYSEDNPIIYKTAEINSYIEKAKRREVGYYFATDSYLYRMLDKYIGQITGKSIGIIGSTIPWYESIVLAYGGHPVTIEYNKIICEDSRLQSMTVKEYEHNPIQFDAIISISSIEHDGLGRYGDPLNPWGDCQAMHHMKTMLKEGGLLFLAVPVGEDCLVWNAHRIYGPIRLPLLLKEWETIDSSGFSLSDYHQKQFAHQPVFVLRPK